MQNESIENENPSCDDEKIELPACVQKRMLEFFLQTSIPRKKAMSNKNPSPENKKAGD